MLILWITFQAPAWACPLWDQPTASENIRKLSADVALHDDLYFNQNAPVISDSEYDALLARLEYWKSCFPSPEKTPQNNQPVIHHAFMGSLKKAKTAAEVERFVASLTPGEILVQPKIDGVAVELVYQQGVLGKASTRGNGEQGLDILWHIKQIPQIPKTLPLPASSIPTLVLHGELLVRLDKIAPTTLQQYASARHLVAGLLNRAEPDATTLQALAFFPWRWIDSPFDSDLETIQALSKMGFITVLKHTHPVQSFAQIQQLRHDYENQQTPFLLDGIVIKANRAAQRKALGWSGNSPAWAMAWKFAPKSTVAEVAAVQFTIGRSGKITPVVHIEPVTVQNKTIAKVSLGSVENLEEKNVAIGDQVSIKLKGGATPVFGEVLFRPPNRALPVLPDTARYNPFTCLSIAPGCEEQFIARLVWLTGKSGLQLASIDRPVITALVKNGQIKTLVDVLRMNQQELIQAGMSLEESVRYFQLLHRPKKLVLQLRALSIPGFGRRKSAELAQCIEQLSELLAVADKQWIKCVGRAKSVRDLQRYFAKPEIMQVVNFLDGNVPTPSVGTSG